MLTINLDAQSPVPMYEQIYHYIKNEIKCGHLPYQTKLPSARNLALNLQVSRNTIDMAYAQLVSEGYLEAIPKSGYYVCQLSDLSVKTDPPMIPSKTEAKPKKVFQYNFSPFAIDINYFPYNVWRKLSKDCMNDNNNELFLLGDNQGDESLRLAIAGYLHGSRGVNCTPDQILVGAGADYLLQLLSQIFWYRNKENLLTNSKENLLTNGKENLLTNGKENLLAMENPTYRQAYKIFSGMNYQIVPINLDSNGINMEELSSSNASIVYVTPSHQYPLGIVMPIKRRLELLQWANSDHRRFIIEDDHDSEFRYKGKPIPSLQGIDTSHKVIYIGTFSRAVAPAIRIGYMVLPKNLLEVYKKYLSYYSSTVSRLDQRIMTDFINGGYFERHLNKMRKLYKNKHDLAIQSLKLFGNRIRIEGENAGLHLVLRIKSGRTEQEIIEQAAKSGIKLYGLSEHYIKKDPLQETKDNLPTLLLGYANISESEIQAGIQILYKALHDFI